MSCRALALPCLPRIREVHPRAPRGLFLARCDPGQAEYLFCQPWPFPSSLMIGLILPAENDDITVDKSELESARWITRAEAREVIAGTHPEISAPMRFAVAHHIMKEWAERPDGSS